MGFLQVSNISKLQNGKPVVDGVSFTQAPFQKLAIAGETGSGKSSLLKMIAGLEQPSNGMIFFQDKHVLGPEFRLVPGHPEIAFLSQHFELRNAYRVEELLSYANKLSDEMANAIFEVCMINHLVKRKTDQLSGGERQRIAIARLLIGAPKLLLLDEPYSNLDLIHKNILKDVIKEIGETLQITCLLVSHDPTDILPWADEIMLMQHGKIVQSGAPEYVYQHPSNTYTASLLGKYQILPPNIADLLLPYSGTAPLGKKIFVRPGNFRIATVDHGVAAHVRNIQFMVGFYELELVVEETIIYIHTLNKHVQKNETIFIALDTKTVQFLG